MKKTIVIALAFMLILTGNPFSETPVDAVSGATSGGSPTTEITPTAPSNLESQVVIPENGNTTPIAPTPNSTPSAWAKEEIDKAIAAGLTVESLLNDYSKPITRAEFSALIVKLYEMTVGTVEMTGLFNPFSDTSDTQVLKAYKLGIVKGTSNDNFSPNRNINRQEIAVMIQREFIASNDQGSSAISSSSGTVFADENQIALWAIDAVRLMSEKGIMIGTGSGKVDPSGYVTREQAMLMIYRSYEKFIAPSDTIPDDIDYIETEDDDEDDD